MLRKKGKRKFGMTVLVGLIVAASAYFALSQIGLSYDKQLICGLQEHIHDELLCYSQPELICGLEETEGHTHTVDCYDGDDNLICDIAEAEPHTHSDACYYTEMELTCGLEETEGDEEAGIEAHWHTDECYYPKLICGLEEHTHSASCYENTSSNNNSNNVVRSDNNNSRGKSDNSGEPILAQDSKDNQNEPADSSKETGEAVVDPDTPVVDAEKTTDAEVPDSEMTDAETPDSETDVAQGNKKPAASNDADNTEETDIEVPETPASEAPDEEEAAIDTEEPSEEEMEEEPAEEEEVEEEPVNTVKPFGVGRGPSPNGDALITTVTIPITKYIDGEDALEALGRAKAGGGNYFFQFLVKDSDGEDVESVNIEYDDFNGGISAEVTITIPIYESSGASPYVYTIEEVYSTAGEEWIYDSNRYTVTVTVESNGDVVAEIKKDDGSTEAIIVNGVATKSYHARKPNPNLYRPLVPGPPGYMDYKIFSVDKNRVHFDDAPISIFIMNSLDETFGEFDALCAEMDGIFPDSGYYYHMIFDDDDEYAEFALLFSLFDQEIRHGAQLSDDEFNTLFGFEPGEITEDLRRGLIQYLIWFENASETFIQESIRYNLFRAKAANYDRAHGGSGKDYLDHFDSVLDTIKKLMAAYRLTEAGKSITALDLVYDADSATSGKLAIGYLGYDPKLPELLLNWDNNAVKVYRQYSGGVYSQEITSGDSVGMGGTFYVQIDQNNVNPVTFELSDELNYFLIGGSIRGAYLSANDDEKNPDLKIFQHLITGTAEFVKLKASLTVGNGKLGFRNLFTTIELPRTFGFGSDLYLITGAMLILASLSLFFAHSVRPVRQGINDESRARLLSLIGKRTRKRWYICRKRE
ncbi:MAG: hypothetical protein FWH57_01055 [Oscillospiraceae bacterium]|nr:hypothetical protein [Oscillospiraceae bacterium]